MRGMPKVKSVSLPPMQDQVKALFTRLGWLSVMLPLLLACTSSQDQSAEEAIYLTGRTMGTNFEVVYVDSLDRVFDREIDSLLAEVNNSMSTYIPNSVISTFNRYDSTDFFRVDHHFYKVYLAAKEIYRQTNHAFDPTVMPLTQYWGFGPGEPPTELDSTVVDSLLQLVRFDRLEGNSVKTASGTTYLVRKNDPRIALDFSAIAKGYGVDVVLQLLADHGISRAFVEIGGEVATMGQKTPGNPWIIGVEDPLNSTLEHRKALLYVGMEDHAIATSGNYRNIREVDGVKYAHTLNPKTGYPVKRNVLSASIIAEECMIADGYATAAMVSAVDTSYQMLLDAPVEGLLIYSTENGTIDTMMTPGFQQFIVKK